MFRRLPYTRLTFTNHISTSYSHSRRLFSTHHANILQQNNNNNNVDDDVGKMKRTQQRSLPSSSSSPSPPTSKLKSAIKSAVVTPLSVVGRVGARVAGAVGSVVLGAAVLGGLYIFSRRLGKAMTAAKLQMHKMHMENQNDPSFIAYQALQVMENSQTVSLIINSPDLFEPDFDKMELSSSRDEGEAHTMVTAVFPVTCHYAEKNKRDKKTTMKAEKAETETDTETEAEEEMDMDMGMTSRTYRLRATASYIDEKYDLKSLELYSTVDDTCIVSLREEEIRDTWEKFVAHMNEGLEEKVQPIEGDMAEGGQGSGGMWQKLFSKGKREKSSWKPGNLKAERSAPIVEDAEFKEK